jgi:FlaA1/EpsC-like NDP-sugar epimerase
MRMSDAVKSILRAAEYAQGGDIFIPKMKAFKLSDLVDVLINYIAPQLNIREEVELSITGLVQGEKLHEILIDEYESSHLRDLGDLYMITPKAESGMESKCILSSNTAELILKNELITIIERYINEFASIYC